MSNLSKTKLIKSAMNYHKYLIQLQNDVISKGYKQTKPYNWEQIFYSPSLDFEGTEIEFLEAGHAYKYVQLDKYRRMVI